MNKSGKYLVWTVLSVMGAFALGYIALNRGEQINALWIVVAFSSSSVKWRFQIMLMPPALSRHRPQYPVG